MVVLEVVIALPVFIVMFWIFAFGFWLAFGFGVWLWLWRSKKHHKIEQLIKAKGIFAVNY